ncbi:hypothetical protein ACS0TY_019699 [Phlomoides rotata]
MTSDSKSSTTIPTLNPAETAITAHPSAVIPISAHHHLPIKLTQTNFPSWRTHLCALLNDFSLIGHIDGSSPSPNATTAPDAYFRWLKQDQLLLAAILGSVLPEELVRYQLGFFLN